MSVAWGMEGTERHLRARADCAEEKWADTWVTSLSTCVFCWSRVIRLISLGSFLTGWVATPELPWVEGQRNGWMGKSYPQRWSCVWNWGMCGFQRQEVLG